MTSMAFVNLSDPSMTVVGTTALEIIVQLSGVRLDLEKRRAVLDGEPDTVSFSDEYSDTELPGVIAARVIEVYSRRGWKLYKG